MTYMPTPCRRLQRGHTYEGKQGFSYFQGIARETTGAQGICMHMLRVPPGDRAKAHLHQNHETAIYVIKGETIMYWGKKLENRMETIEGDLIYIPAGMPHLPLNVSDKETVAIVARTDPHEQESVVLRLDLERYVPDAV